MRKTQFPWILGGILLLAWAAGGIIGLVLAATGLSGIYLASLRVHPRIRHGRCKGTGEHRGAVFTWTHRKCGKCSGGRIVRWGAGHWGSEPVRAEHQSAVRARAAARESGTWR